MTPGSHSPADPPDRSLGQLRDTILVILPGPRLMPVAIHRAPPEGTLSDNVLRHAAGGLDIGACRVSTGSPKQVSAGASTSENCYGDWRGAYVAGTGRQYTGEGRWPPNVLLVHGPGCRQTGTMGIPCRPPSWPGGSMTSTSNSLGRYGSTDAPAPQSRGPSVVEPVPAWDCRPGCPVPHLDGQGVAMGSHPVGTAIRRVGPGSCKGYHPGALGTESRPEGWTGIYHGDSGTVSRFFPQLPDPDAAHAWIAALLGLA